MVIYLGRKQKITLNKCLVKNSSCSNDSIKQPLLFDMSCLLGHLSHSLLIILKPTCVANVDLDKQNLMITQCRASCQLDLWFDSETAYIWQVQRSLLFFSKDILGSISILETLILQHIGKQIAIKNPPTQICPDLLWVGRLPKKKKTQGGTLRVTKIRQGFSLTKTNIINVGKSFCWNDIAGHVTCV